MPINTIGPFALYDSNIYLLTGERNALIDTGTGQASSLVIGEIRRILDGRHLDYVILTHCHYDHVGGLEAILAETGAKAMAGRADADVISNADSRYTLDTMFGGRLNPVPVDPLDDGDVIDLGDRRLRVISTPGHTAGGICLYDESSRDLFSGDTVFLEGIGRTDFPGGSFQDLASSVRAISNIDIRGLYPGHGNATAEYGPDHLVRALRLVGELN